MKFAIAMFVCLVGCSILSGCCHIQERAPKTVEVAEVINKVKDELRLVGATSQLKYEQKAPPGAVCKDPDGYTRFVLTPDTAKLTLKTVVTDENDPTAGLTSPIGVLSIDPSYSGAYSSGHSQTLELDLNVVDTASTSKGIRLPASAAEHPLAAAILGMAKGWIDADHSQYPCITGTALKAVISFDVVDKTTSGLGIQLLIFKLGDKEVFTNENHQTLEFDFSLAGSSAALY